jgi:hypothetical protein
MRKHFKKLPKDLDRYNPIKMNLNASLTSGIHDENNLLHSYNGDPALLKITGQERAVSWYSHGVLAREEDKPCRIFFGEGYYETFNENNNLHSYGENPATIGTYDDGQSYSVEWKQDGILHRDNDKPARLFYTNGFIENEFYFVNGQEHRSNGQPAVVSPQVTAWYVCGRLHNKNGLAFVNSGSSFVSDSKYGLYGVELSLEAFERIKETEWDKNVPIWVAFLSEFKLINDDQLEAFAAKTWEYSLPLTWQLRMLDISNQKFVEAVRSQTRNDKRIKFQIQRNTQPLKLDSFIAIVKTDTKDALVKLSERKNA